MTLVSLDVCVTGHRVTHNTFRLYPQCTLPSWGWISTVLLVFAQNVKPHPQPPQDGNVHWWWCGGVYILCKDKQKGTNPPTCRDDQQFLSKNLDRFQYAMLHKGHSLLGKSNNRKHSRNLCILVPIWEIGFWGVTLPRFYWFIIDYCSFGGKHCMWTCCNIHLNLITLRIHIFSVITRWIKWKWVQLVSLNSTSFY